MKTEPDSSLGIYDASSRKPIKPYLILLKRGQRQVLSVCDENEGRLVSLLVFDNGKCHNIRDTQGALERRGYDPSFANYGEEGEMIATL